MSVPKFWTVQRAGSGESAPHATSAMGVPAVEPRLAALERENRRLRRLMLAGLAALALLALAQAQAGRIVEAQPRTVTAEQFILVDANGQARALLGVDDGGGATFALLGAPDALQQGSNAPVAIFTVNRIQAIAVLAGSVERTPAVELTTVGQGPAGDASILIYDGTGTPEWAAP